MARAPGRADTASACCRLSRPKKSPAVLETRTGQFNETRLIMTGKKPLTAERLRSALSYNEETGEFRRLASGGMRCPAGSIAGTTKPNGYRQIAIDSVIFLAHRLAWLHVHGVWPDGQIDHINGNRADNRLDNLRDVTQAINQQNRRAVQKGCLSGVFGAHFIKSSGRYRSSVAANGVSFYLGTFPTAEIANKAFIFAKRATQAGNTL